MANRVSFGRSLGRYSEALTFIFSRGLAWYFMFPLVLHIALIYFSINGADALSDVLQQAVSDRIARMSNEWSGILQWMVSGVIWLIIKVLFFLLFTFIGGYIVLILLSPMLAHLSEKCEMMLQGRTYQFDLYEWGADTLRGIVFALRNMLIEVLIMLAVFMATFFLGWIPVVGWTLALAGQLFLLIVSAYYYGLSFMYYTVERRHLSIGTATAWGRSHRWEAIGTGLPFVCCLMIPFIGVFIASFMAVTSTVAGTITACELLEE